MKDQRAGAWRGLGPAPMLDRGLGLVMVLGPVVVVVVARMRPLVVMALMAVKV